MSGWLNLDAKAKVYCDTEAAANGTHVSDSIANGHRTTAHGATDAREAAHPSRRRESGSERERHTQGEATYL